MKAISIHSLYATAIARQEKTIELRSWRTSYRGDILICTSKTDSNNEEIKDYLIFGHAIALATIYDCVPFKENLRRYSYVDPYLRLNDYYCFLLENIRPIKPIPIKGQQRIFNVDIEREDLEILDIDSLKDPDKLINYWYENGYIKNNNYKHIIRNYGIRNTSARTRRRHKRDWG